MTCIHAGRSSSGGSNNYVYQLIFNANFCRLVHIKGCISDRAALLVKSMNITEPSDPAPSLTLNVIGAEPQFCPLIGWNAFCGLGSW